MLEPMPKSWLFLHYLKLTLACAVLASVAGVAIQATLLLRAATVAARALPVAVTVELQATRTALLAEVRGSRSDLAGQIESTRKDLLGRTERQVAALRIDVMGEAAQIRGAADRRVGDTLARVDVALGKVEELHTDLHPTLVHAANVAKQVDDEAPLFLDCEYNPDCVFNRYVGLRKASNVPP